VKTRITIRPRARNDLDAISDWYEEKQEGLGRRFLAAVSDVLEFVSRFPRGRPQVRGEIRRANLTGFPYAIFYLYRGNRIWVFTVQHQARITRKRLEELF
jgi:plasmid stabilization system protein ParE